MDREQALALWMYTLYGHHGATPRPAVLAQILRAQPEAVGEDFRLACAVGNVDQVRAAIAADPERVNRPGPAWTCPACGKPVVMPPLVGITHSSLLSLPEFRERLHACARLLLDRGADPNQSYLEGADPLSALYGAAGRYHDPDLTRMLLDAGANPNDNESLYHSVETESVDCMSLLLEAGARVENSNALHHCLDTPFLDKLQLLLRYTTDANDSGSGLGPPLLWAIRRGRSRAHIAALLAAGADPHGKSKDSVSAYRLAMMMGLTDVAEALRDAGAAEPLDTRDQFVAACAMANEPEARRLLAANPDVIASLSEPQLRQLPQLVESGKHDAARLMVSLGWPIAIRGGDWGASALNHAVYQGNPDLTRFLLEHGASWEERHNFDDNAGGTLAWASRNAEWPEADWVGCARALLDHGMPLPGPGAQFSPPVAAFFAAERAKAGMEPA